MSKIKLFSTEFFPNFQDKDAFFDKITQKENVFTRILNNYLLLNLFAFFYGLVMGCYNSVLQAISSGIKVPVLLTLTLFISFPAFFMIQYVLGSKLRLNQMISIILSGYVLTSAIMAAFAPIVIFFLLTGSDYDFLKLLHVGIIALSGFFGMRTIIEALKFSCEKTNIYPKIGVVVFRFWVIILAFVGIQLSWVLRPFIGDKERPFEPFRKQEGNFYKAMIHIISKPFQDTQTQKMESDSTVQGEVPSTN